MDRRAQDIQRKVNSAARRLKGVKRTDPIESKLDQIAAVLKDLIEVASMNAVR